MNIEIRKLSVENMADWLDFFDNVAFEDNKEWSGCYCMCHLWDEELNRRKAWGCSVEDAEFNRNCAIDFIKSERMQGYLAYSDGKVVGWCNANDKNSYGDVVINFKEAQQDENEKIKAIVCFCIAPKMRGTGIASMLLEEVCNDAQKEGFECIEAYPFEERANHDFHGSEKMYEKFGFKQCGNLSGCAIYRKQL